MSKRRRDASPPPPLDRAQARRLAFERARQDWPEVGLEFPQFCEALERAGHVDTLPRYSSAFFLCAACGVRDLPAWKALEREFLPVMLAAVRRVVVEPDLISDVLQEVRRRLFVECSPKITTYRGIGPLAAWLRIVAINIALDQRREIVVRRRKSRQLGLLAPPADHELEMLRIEDGFFRREVAHVCEQALVSAVNDLQNEDRRLLSLYFVSGLSVDALAPMYAIDRSTVARRIRRHLDRIRDSIQAVAAAAIPGSGDDIILTWRTHFECTAFSAAALLDTPAPIEANAGGDAGGLHGRGNEPAIAPRGA